MNKQPSQFFATRREASIALFLVVALLLGSGVGLWSIWAPARQMVRTANGMIGQREADLIRTLGPPKHVVTATALGGRTVDYPWKGENFVPIPTHPVQNKVLLYSEFNVAVYIYIDKQGIVERVATAGT